MHEIREDANRHNVKSRLGNHINEDFPKEERLSPLLTKYAVISGDSHFSKQLVNSQI